MRDEVVARGAGSVRGCSERSSAVRFVDLFHFLTGARCSNQAENRYMRGRGIFLLSNCFGFIFIVFAVLLCRAVLSLSYCSTYSKHFRRGKGLPYLGYVRTYGM